MSTDSNNNNNGNDQNKHTSDFKGKENNAQSLGLGEKSWRSLMEVSVARSRKIRGSNYVQLATVDPATNQPRCRTVVFRGFQTNHQEELRCDDLSTVMKLCTDARSKKVQESAVAEMVWWFPKSNEQYRLRGKILYIGGDDDTNEEKAPWKTARKELWGNLSDAARESFLDPKVPGEPIDGTSNSSEEAAIPTGGRDAETGKPVPPPEGFLLVLLFPTHVDYLNLKENYRQIDVFDQEKREWSFQTVNA